MNDAPEKLYYSISEVSDATGVKAHVLRYWESQFPMLRPRKSRGGMRMYRAKDAAIIQRIKYLLYDRGFTIAGARRKLFEDRRSGISYEAFELEAREASFSIREESGAGEDAEAGAAEPATSASSAAPAAGPGIASRQLEFGSAAPPAAAAQPDAPADAPAMGPGATLQEIRAEIELLQAMLMAPPRLKIRT